MASREKTAQIRQQIVEATDELLYRKGFNLMSFSDIAEASDTPRGNLYYYFKTKDEVLAAVIERRVQQMSQMLDDWDDSIPTPLDRLKRFAHIVVTEQERVQRYGCPMGSLNTELGKSQQPLQALAKRQFDVFKTWLTRQFQALDKGDDSEELAMHLLVRSQGIAVMSQVYGDAALIDREVAGINEWLESLV